MAIKLMARFLFTPLFHDITLWGRILSFIYRLGRIVFGIATLFLVDILLILLFGFWFVLPVYLLYLDIRTIIILLTAAFVYALGTREGYRQKISDFDGEIDFKSVSSDDLQNAMQDKKTGYQLLKTLTSNDSFQKKLTKIGIDPRVLDQEIENNRVKFDQNQGLGKLQGLILEKAKLLSSENLNLYHLFLALLTAFPALEEIVAKFDLDQKMVQEAVGWLEDQERSIHHHYIWDKDFHFHALAGVNRTLEGTVTPGLDSFIRDLTAEAKRGVLPQSVDRKNLVEQISLILARSEANNVILVGEAGSGKTFLVYNLAEKIIKGEAPAPLRFKRLVALDYTAVLGGAKTDGEILERMKKIIGEIEYSGNVILYLDEIQSLITDESQSSVVYSALAPHLSSAKFQVIASISYENYHKTLEQNEEFANLFQKVEVPETTEEETLAILKTVAPLFEKRQKVTISYPAILAAIDLSRRYMHERVLPDKAVSILDEAAVAVSSHNPGGLVGREDVAKVVSLKSHLPVTKITLEEEKKLLNLEEVLHQRMVDQEEAVGAVADALRRARAGIREEGRPIASFLFVGPTGVGKTELARTLAEFYFGSEDAMIRLDMSEFQNKESIYSLIGPPLGQEGAEFGGRLTEAIRRRPFSLLLLDEVEKAHGDVLNLFLQVMDEARLTASNGRTVDFSNAIIIATSNSGTRLIQEEIEKKTEMTQIKDKIGEFLKTVFKPEFLNRFDGIIVFKPLAPKDVEKVAEFMIKRLTKNLAQKGIKVEVSPGFLVKLAGIGYDPTMGARPLRRLIQDTVEAKISKAILAEELKKGSTFVLDESMLNK